MTGSVPSAGGAPWRLLWLHVASRRAPAAVLVFAGLAVTLRIALRWLPGAGTGARLVPLLVEAGVAAALATTTRSPFGELDRATGRYLPLLRLATVLGLAAAGTGALAAAVAAGHLPDGTAVVLRDFAGLAGVALLTSAVLGGSLAWLGPLTYTVMCAVGLDAGWTTLWLWPLRPAHDHAAMTWAVGLLAAGVAVSALRGARDSVSE